MLRIYVIHEWDDVNISFDCVTSHPTDMNIQRNVEDICIGLKMIQYIFGVSVSTHGINAFVWGTQKTRQRKENTMQQKLFANGN